VYRWIATFCIVLVLVGCTITPPPAPNLSVTPARTSTPANTLQPTQTFTPTARPGPSATRSATRGPLPANTSTLPAGGVPRPDHVVVVILENRSYAQILGNACCAYLNQQTKASALMTRSFAVTHPSQPNYLDLFSGSDQGVTDDSCPPPGSPYSTPNLGQELENAGLTFAGFSEDLPAAASTACSTSTYALKHNPWVNFSNVPSSDNLPFSSFPDDFTKLPIVSFVVPNLCHDMHDCAPSSGDDWMSSHLGAYIHWTTTHNSLLIVTFDEDDYHGTNQVVTFFEGAMVKPGHYSERITHYNVLRTLEAMYGLPHAGQAANVSTITDIWNGPTSPAP
jgi:hypothetical protein